MIAPELRIFFKLNADMEIKKTIHIRQKYLIP